MIPQADTLVVIVNYNTGCWLKRCLKALFESTQKPDVVVVDNQSVDNSLEALDEFPHNTQNMGFGSACNQGAKQANENHQFIWFLNPDTEVEQQTMHRLCRLLQQQSKAVLVGALVVGEDGKEQRACRRYLPTLRRAMMSFSGLSVLGSWMPLFQGVNINTRLPAQAIEVEAISGASIFVRKSSFEQIGGFDQGFFLHCEDLDLFYRLKQQGGQIWFEPQARITHAKGVSQHGNRLRSESYKHQGMKYYFAKHHTGHPIQFGVIRLLINLRYYLMAPRWRWQQWRQTNQIQKQR